MRINGAVCIPGKVVSGKGVATGQAYRQPTSRPISLSMHSYLLLEDTFELAGRNHGCLVR